MRVQDPDLQAVQQVRDLIRAAVSAQHRWATFSQAQVDAVVDAMAEAAAKAAESLARQAVEETGMGVIADKVVKNLFCSQDLYRAIRPLQTVGLIREDREGNILEYAEPVGVVAAIIPTTNPTSTAIYKVLISLKARNAVILSPHPNAKGCICATADVLTKAAMTAGAPEGLIGCLTQVSPQATQELMRHRDISLILATGGTGLVRAAYSSGKPAFGVGPGNVPVVIERSADIRKAVADTVTGKTFDFGTICSSEQAIITEEAIRDAVLRELRAQGGYFLNAEEKKSLERTVFRPGSFLVDPKVVGRSPQVIAEMAGFQVPPEVRVLVVELAGVGREHPLSAEKLSPVLGFFTTENFRRAVEVANSILEFGGLGHTAVIHSSNDNLIRDYGARIRAYRVVVNSPAPHGSIGYSTNLFPAMTLGCGAPGNNITSDNIGPHHLMNIKRVAYETRPVEPSIKPRPAPPARQVLAPAMKSPSGPVRARPKAEGEEKVPERQVIARVVERFLKKKGSDKRPAPVVREESPPPVKPPLPSGPPPSVPVSEFVAEADVRSALERGEKIYIASRTILTPSARELGRDLDIFVETS